MNIQGFQDSKLEEDLRDTSKTSYTHFIIELNNNLILIKEMSLNVGTLSPLSAVAAIPAFFVNANDEGLVIFIAYKLQP